MELSPSLYARILIAIAVMYIYGIQTGHPDNWLLLFSGGCVIIAYLCHYGLPGLWRKDSE